MISSLLLRRCIAALAVASLSACVADATVVDRHSTSAQAAGKAIVIVSVSHDRTASGASARFFIDGDTPDAVKIESAAGHMEIPIRNHFRDKYGHVYVLELPPGHHRFTTWSARWRNRSTHVVEGQVPLEFDAASGEVVYIGNLHATWLLGKGWIGRPLPYAATVAINDNSKADLAIAERETPAIAGRARVELLPLGPWGKMPPEPTVDDAGALPDVDSER
jgi:hypothetical protein